MHIDFLSHLVFSQLCSHFIKICTWNICFLSEKLWGIFWVFWLFEKFDLDLHEHLPSPQDLEMLVIFQYQPVNRAAVNYAWKTRKWSVTHATLCCIQVPSSNTISELWKMLLIPSFKKIHWWFCLYFSCFVYQNTCTSKFLIYYFCIKIKINV